MARRKDVNWNISEPTQTWVEVQAAILMDIRDELKELNRTVGCYNARAIPYILRGIRKNTQKRKYVKRKKITTRR